tara:strand:+ start:2968 stop:3744 length:777 start_codon:yes stop_codon:yes gene_type:complete
MENFGTIKDTFNNILAESIIKKNDSGKKLFGKYIKLLTENKTLKSQYLIYKNLESRKFTNESDAKFFIKENISLLKELNKNNISKGNQTLLTLLKGNDMIKENIELYDHIDILVNTKKTATSLDTLHKSLNFIKDKMVREEINEIEEYETINLPPSVLSKMAVNRFNSKYSNITEDEKKILKSVLNGTDKNKEEVYNTLKIECIDLIDNKLNEEIDLGLKDKMLKVKDKLLRMSYNPDEYVKDIDKVYELKKSVAAEE